MAVIIGDTGTVTFANGYVVNVKAWTLNVVADEHDVTDFAASAWAVYLTGLKRWSGSYECWLDDTTTLPRVNPGVDDTWAASTGTATFTSSTGRTFAGTIFITGNDIKIGPADPNTVTINFRGSGALTLA